jgi:elongation factor P
MKVTIESHEGRPIGIAIPDQVTLKVVEAEPVVRGQTAASSYKPAMLENGVRTMVPPHITSGTRVVISTADGSYVERAKD